MGERIRHLPACPGPWTVRRIWRQLGLVAEGDPNRRRTLAAVRRPLRALPRGSVIWAVGKDVAVLVDGPPQVVPNRPVSRGTGPGAPSVETLGQHRHYR